MKTIKLSEALADNILNIEKAYVNPNALTGITTGFRDIDEKLGGLHKSDLIILSGRSDKLKLNLAINIAFNTANAYNKDNSNGGVVLYFSISQRYIADKIISAQAEIPLHQMKSGNINQNQFKKIVDKTQEISETELYINYNTVINIDTLKKEAIKTRKNCGLDLIVIDNLQLLQENSKKQPEEIICELKTIAKELNITIIVLSMLHFSRKNKFKQEPNLTNFEHPIAIKQFADIVMFVHQNENENEMELIIAKNHLADLGKIELNYKFDIVKFSNLNKKG